MNIYLFHRDLRLFDNTTLIEQLKNQKSVVPIFIFTPEQINKKKNKYFSDNSVQFMIESLHDLSKNIKKKSGKLYFFHGDNIKVLNQILKSTKINSIGYNFDYSPYAQKRDNKIDKWAKKNNIKVYCKEDFLLYDLKDGQTKNKTEKPYLVFTPFKNHCFKNLKVRKVDKFKNYKFSNLNTSKIKTFMDENKIDKYYNYNENLNVNGGRKNGKKILKQIGKKWDDYDDKRNCMVYKTTFLSAYLHFNVLSIREVYHKVLKHFNKKHGLINELHWRDFYVNIMYFFPYVLNGMVGKKNESFKKKYDNLKWINNIKQFKKWCDGETGFPIVDACMRQMNQTGYMHNRGRMIVASFLIKDLLIDWRWGEKYFATKLVDYDPSSNNGGWLWASGGGTDAQPYFRIFNPWTQSSKFDPNCNYIKKWVPQLKEVPNKEIHNWNTNYQNYLKKIDYFEPMVDHKAARIKTLEYYKKI